MKSFVAALFAVLLACSAAPVWACAGSQDCANGLVFIPYGPTSPGPASVMAVFLHGDVSSGGSADYMLSSAQRFVADVPGASAAVLIRPGYFDRHSRVSEGSDCGRRDCYTEEVVGTVTEAIAQVKQRFGARTVIGLGHSGGAAILANVIARRPGLIGGAVLVSCPCDIRRWRPQWQRSLSPIDLVGSVRPATRLVAITGRDDETAGPQFAERYVEALRAAGKNAVFIPTQGTHDYRSVRDAALLALRDLATAVK
ncbi:putative esterase [Bosea sp. BE125]|uniref:alpha/beta hydrolase n=1 Tax=Bosea sp. BE125 TaxID=2817909 RepID=UPI00285F843B|nr:alpha/beta fold hydrolase [Bosea sp. BE125]MDR6873144.1 putative esterase [Bosea sp. BE125]